MAGGLLLLFPMRQAQPKPKSTTTRKARVAVVVARAKAAGEKVPCGVKLISFQPISDAAQAHAAMLVPAARRTMTRSRSAAA